MKGRVAKYLSFRGYGFISVETQEDDIFFHMSNYPPRVIPKQGQLLEFDINQTPKGLEAINIKLDSSESSETEVTSESDLNELENVSSEAKVLLEKSNVISLEDLTGYTPEMLLTNMISINDEEKITETLPSLDEIRDWIDQANKISK